MTCPHCQNEDCLEEHEYGKTHTKIWVCSICSKMSRLVGYKLVKL